jgi:sporadic carbohydrate cluster protein (TIGR04323 family)
MNADRSGYRGYMATRPVRGTTIPQRVQNLVIRDYASRNKLPYLMTVSEFAMPGCYMILENALLELDRTRGIIAFSLFMLPPQAERRRSIYRRILDAGASLHAALENLSIHGESDIDRVEDLISAALLLERLPFAGRYDKSERALAEANDPFVRALLAAAGPSLVTERT